jgi:hypothetical protein
MIWLNAYDLHSFHPLESVFRVGFRYFLDLTYEPKYNTYTWTLDYNRNSDFGKSSPTYFEIVLI